MKSVGSAPDFACGAAAGSGSWAEAKAGYRTMKMTNTSRIWLRQAEVQRMSLADATCILALHPVDSREWCAGDGKTRYVNSAKHIGPCADGPITQKAARPDRARTTEVSTVGRRDEVLAN